MALYDPDDYPPYVPPVRRPIGFVDALHGCRADACRRGPKLCDEPLCYPMPTAARDSAEGVAGIDDGPATGRVVPPQERRERIERVVYGVLAMVALAIGAGAMISTWHKARDSGAVVVPALAASRVTT